MAYLYKSSDQEWDPKHCMAMLADYMALKTYRSLVGLCMQ